MWLECSKHVEKQATALRRVTQKRLKARVEAEQLLREVLRVQKDEMESEKKSVESKTEVKLTEDDRAAVDRVLAKTLFKRLVLVRAKASWFLWTVRLRLILGTIFV
ncbi:hypothetical protein PsorP6_014860 [Peronosclerospora sorghi]|uniref:Uncharacterized protein n=1 Tax=Peronosclerospora sorghi TaxID=230839 RepID=A0ACC0VS53_9STRA|nr:hypothetical protein PsorP6_014860 [Peronosclerospora sorghi]